MAGDYPAFGKIYRYRRECLVTEKIDGTNGLIQVTDYGDVSAFSDDLTLFLESTVPLGINGVRIGDNLYGVRAGSRNRWLTADSDNYGFAAWVRANAHDLARLGPGHHYGEWWGQGIQRKYGLDRKVFSLFDAHRWNGVAPQSTPPECVSVVPVIAQGVMGDGTINAALTTLRLEGSLASWIESEGIRYPNPEGIVIYHIQTRTRYKVLLENDDIPKSVAG